MRSDAQESKEGRADSPDAASVAAAEEVENKKVDVVIVGGGPVGLWTAIQLKSKCPNINIQILERYEQYKRTQTLRLDLNEITNDVVKEKLLEIAREHDLTQKKNSLAIPIQLLEGCFSEVARDLGIKVKKNVAIVPKTPTVKPPDALLAEVPAGEEVKVEVAPAPRQTLTLSQIGEVYPNAKAIIGADGSHSTVREAHFGPEEKMVERQTVQYLAEFKYRAQVKDAKGKKLKYQTEAYPTEKLAGFRCDETIKIDPETDTATITLRFIVDKKTYEEMGEASFKKPITDLDQLPFKLKTAISVWMHAREQLKRDVHIPTHEKVNKIPLDIYTSREFVKRSGKQTVFLVGDAAFGVPYFRALNAGLSCANVLAMNLAVTFQLGSEPVPDAYIKALKEKYESEKTLATAKDFGLRFWKKAVMVGTSTHLDVNRWRGETRQEMRKPHEVFVYAAAANEQKFLSSDKAQTEEEQIAGAKQRISSACTQFLTTIGNVKVGLFYAPRNDRLRAGEIIEVLNICPTLDQVTNLITNFIRTGQMSDKTPATHSPMLPNTLRWCLARQFCPDLFENEFKLANHVKINFMGKITLPNKEALRALINFKPAQPSVELHV